MLIENFGVEPEAVTALIREAYAAGAEPIVILRDMRVQRALMLGATAEKWDEEARVDADRMRAVDAYIGLRAGTNAYEQADVPPEKQRLYMQHYSQPVHSLIRVPDTRWVVLRDATPAMAQMAEMSTEAFEDFYFDVCTMDYSRMEAAMAPLKALMERTDRVHILGPGTDLTFSIKGMPAVPCAGRVNIPDGEIFTAPVRESVNGTIAYNVPSTHDGFSFENMRLTFRDGRITSVACNDGARAERVFDQDEGARYVGEFALGVNPYITRPMNNTLFDEKIMGSFHFTPGACYDECDNGNRSALHWDLVCIQTPEYGGGEIWFDGVLVRKDGHFVLPELEALNPERLR